MAELTSQKESAARKRIDATLNNLYWSTDEASPSCNVFTERAKTLAQSRLLEGRPPDYTLYRTGSDEPIGIIEAKKPGKTLREALNQAIKKYAKPLGIPIVFASDGSITETHDIRSSTTLRIDGDVVTDLVTEQILLRFIAEGSNIETPREVSLSKQKLIRVFKDANDLLRNEGLREGIERFTEFSNLLFLKLISEIEDEREQRGEARILERRYCWDQFCHRNAEDMLDYINDTILPRLVNRYNHNGDVFQSKLLIKTPSTIKRIVDKLSELTLLNADSDIKGDAFEYFLKNSVTVGNDLGEYFTPRHIVRLMVELIDPRYGETVYDPCCGTGGFLIYAFEHIKKKVLLTHDALDLLKNHTVFGRELTGTAKIAKMNMILTGDGHTNIVQTDSLSEPIKNRYDVVLTNYPFSQKTDYASYYGLNYRDANPVFLKHVIDALKPGGRAGVVVPDGVLFGERTQYVRVRKMLLRECNVRAVIKLHNYVFKPYAGQPTSILIFEKGKPTSDVWFFDVKDDGYKKTGSKLGRPPIAATDLITLRQAWGDSENTSHSFTVNSNIIAKNGHKLIPNLYHTKPVRSENWVPLGGDTGLCDIIIGKTPSTQDSSYWDGPYLWATITDFSKKYIGQTNRTITTAAVQLMNDKLVPPSTLLFSFKLSIGKTAISQHELYTNEAIAALVPKDGRVLTEYLYYILPALDFTQYQQPAAKGLTLNKRSLPKILVPVPSIKEQEVFIQAMRRKDDEVNQYLDRAEKVRLDAKGLLQDHISGFS